MLAEFILAVDRPRSKYTCHANDPVTVGEVGGRAGLRAGRFELGWLRANEAETKARHCSSCLPSAKHFGGVQC